ncbi:ATP-binding cassette domain-containing protein [Escherichia coli]|nr:ATP-binding cassette domain-containing protein [Escherichia coli]
MPRDAMETFLSLRHINKTFHATRALRDVSLDFMSGEVHCLAGQNGCGKSTLIKNYVRCLSPG